MDMYTTRVELLRVAAGKSSDDAYDKLHKQMELKGFIRTITGSDGVIYQLPPAEYNLLKDGTTPGGVVKMAREAATAAGHQSRVLVTKGTRSWEGLDHVPVPAKKT